jgi:hypothetical protein
MSGSAGAGEEAGLAERGALDDRSVSAPGLSASLDSTASAERNTIMASVRFIKRLEVRSSRQINTRVPPPVELSTPGPECQFAGTEAIRYKLNEPRKTFPGCVFERAG